MKESTILGLHNDGEADALYDSWSSFLERKLYPTTEAINNVFALAARSNRDRGLKPSGHVEYALFERVGR